MVRDIYNGNHDMHSDCYISYISILAKIDPYLEASMGAPYQRTQRTQVIPGTCNPRWNSSMQFFVRNANEDVLCLTVFDKDYFAPNGRLR